MKIFISIFAVAIALAFTGPAFAGDVKNAKSEQDCVRDGGTWNDASKTCARTRCKSSVVLARLRTGVGFGRAPFIWLARLFPSAFRKVD